jgi:hypothetical protein
MKYLCHYSWEPNAQKQAEAIRRFKEVGTLTPKGTKLIGRWTNADFMGGVVVFESDDPVSVTAFSLMWSDLMTLKIVPVLEDQELVEALSRADR